MVVERFIKYWSNFEKFYGVIKVENAGISSKKMWESFLPNVLDFLCSDFLHKVKRPLK